MIDYLLSFDPGTKNIAYCLIEVKTLKIIKWEVFSIESSTYEGRVISLAKQLDLLNSLNIPGWTGTVRPKIKIVIEQQMGINTKTNRVCGMLLMYYALEKIDENPNIPLTQGIVDGIVHYPAKHKITYYNWKDGDEPFFKTPIKKNDHHFITERIFKLKKGHYRTKKILIEHCRRILIHNDETQHWKDFFVTNKKKADDLSDSAIQGLMYIRMYNLRKV
jgi:hypothetical protein